MIIIFGTRPREKTIATGEFHCPSCQQTRPYEKKEAGQYFTLFFIPLFKVKELGTHIVCNQCHNQYNATVLSYRPPSPVQQAADIVRRDLDSGTPIEMARQKLANQQVDPALAEQALITAIGTGRYICHSCNYTYRKTVNQCTNCGQPLHLA